MAGINTGINTPKRAHSEVSAASPSDASPDSKLPRGAPKLLQFNFEDMPANDNSPAAQWGQFLLKQMEILNKNISTIASSSEFANDQAAEALVEIAKTNSVVAKVTASLADSALENAKLKHENIDLKEKLLSLECYSRRNNLVFEGIRESRGETDFHCYSKVVDALSNIPDLSDYAFHIRISRCHRVGPFIPNQVRPIIAHFHWYGDRQTILRLKNQLPRGIFVNEDFPQEYVERRAELRPVYKAAIRMEKYKGKVHWNKDKLVIDHKAYSAGPKNNLCDLPAELQPSKLCERESETCVAFLGSGSPHSNFSKSPFVIDNVPYVHNEQFIQKSKAEMFNDDVTASRIMRETNPLKIKRLGDNVKGFIQQQWEQHAESVATKGALAKFQQNPRARTHLLNTGNKTIVEASRDSFWGVGLKLDDPGVLDEQNWTGANLMGNVLIKVRDMLKQPAPRVLHTPPVMV